MSLRKLTAGDGYSYLTRQVAAHDTTEKGHTSLADYYDEKGEAPGRWMGAGLAGLGMQAGETVTAEQMKALFGLGQHPNAATLQEVAANRGAGQAEVEAAGALGVPFRVFAGASTFRIRTAEAFTAYNRERGLRWNTAIPVDERARIRTAIGQDMFREEHGRDPQDSRELSGFVARASRQATSAVAGFDLTFSPVKSVSALWAIADADVAAEIRAAHEAAVADTLSWLEREVAHTRVGKGGARQVEVRGLVAAAFVHRDSRAGDPDLHTHVAVSNKVQTEDGRWLALDGRLVYAAKVAASERYNTRLEAELVERLGVQFVEREEFVDKLPVREIRGVSTSLTRWWSRRRVAIEARQSVLASEFQSRHGRPPTASEAIALGDQATLESRPAKHGHRSEVEQRRVWRDEAAEVLGGHAELEEMCRRVFRRRARPARPIREWVENSAVQALSWIESGRATWQVWHVRAEAERRARAAGIDRRQLDEAVDLLTEAVLSRSVQLGSPDPIREPGELRRRNGESVYDVHGAARFTSARVLAAEQELLAAARLGGFRALTDVRVEVALTQSKANGFQLNDAQAAMVRDLATSGSALQLALAPAGTGKTTTMSVLADAWTKAGGQVIGLAPSAQAAHELGQAITGHTDTLAKLTWTLAHEAPEQWPAWITHVGPSSIVIIDEAGQASTTELATAVRYVTDRGGVVRLVGDDQQLASVGAGGILRDIQNQVGASTLSEVRRFADPAEAAATLAVREGDSGALGFYADNGRVHVGGIGSAADQAYAAWSADRAAGLDSVLLAPTRDQVAQLNARARADRLRAPGRGGSSIEVELRDGNRASAGDLIVTRRNARTLTISRSNWVKNGDRWAVEQVHPDGRLLARHLELDRGIELPADYVREHVQLGYASTVHGAQGMTTDTAHVMVAGEETRQLLYVALSRGRAANHIYVATAHDGDPHSAIDPKALIPLTAIDVLAEILDRDGSDRSATTTQREAEAPSTLLHEAVMRYHDALGVAAESVLGAERLAALDAEAEIIWPGLTEEPAYPTLRAHLALRALDGADPIATLLDAAATRELGSSEDRAAVLDWRIGGRSSGPLPWLDGIPARVENHPTWGPYLAARRGRITYLAEIVREQALSWSPRTSPGWAAGLSAEEHAELRADVGVWRAAFAVPDDEERVTGAPQPGSADAGHQRGLDRRVRSVLGVRRAGRSVIDRLPEEVRADEHFDRLQLRLAALETADIDVPSLVDQALEQPQPLPDERAADALWWRLVRHLGPAALRATSATAPTLRPAWTTYLLERLGADTAERVMADAMWPALVAAVHARPTEWTAEQLIESATSGTGPGVCAEDLCSALVWRVATMTDPTAFEEPEPPELWIPAEHDPPQLLPAAPTTSAPATTSADRIIELNRLALAYFEDRYTKSWAPDYLRERLGTDLIDDPRFEVGYAPPGPASLTQHLLALGASSDQLVDAGLARVNYHGRVIDAFRDRLMFPIHADTRVVGFIGRRNPNKGEGDYAGPKYLNSRGTVVFTKGELLFGLSEGAAHLDNGATPVLVEGPLDAIAVTIATDGRAVGVAPLGTAFTERQAAQLVTFFQGDPTNVVIATDADEAGWQSAQRAFWRLVALRANPGVLPLPGGADPADVLRIGAAPTLDDLLSRRIGLGRMLIDRAIDEHLDPEAAARIWLARDLARIIGALPPQEWPDHCEYVARRVGLPTAMIHAEVLEAGTEWTDAPGPSAQRELARLRQGAWPNARRTAPSEATLSTVQHPSPPLDVARIGRPSRPGFGR